MLLRLLLATLRGLVAELCNLVYAYYMPLLTAFGHRSRNSATKRSIMAAGPRFGRHRASSLYHVGSRAVERRLVRLLASARAVVRQAMVVGRTLRRTLLRRDGHKFSHHLLQRLIGAHDERVVLERALLRHIAAAAAVELGALAERGGLALAVAEAGQYRARLRDGRHDAR
jgi:hypothetical protein